MPDAPRACPLCGRPPADGDWIPDASPYCWAEGCACLALCVHCERRDAEPGGTVCPSCRKRCAAAPPPAMPTGAPPGPLARRHGRWEARVTVRGRVESLGTFATEFAAVAYRTAWVAAVKAGMLPPARPKG